jgi:hypothetical protein
VRRSGEHTWPLAAAALAAANEVAVRSSGELGQTEECIERIDGTIVRLPIVGTIVGQTKGSHRGPA